MKKKDTVRLIIFLAIILIGFIVAILVLSWPLLTGTTHVLATQPVDPFDIFRGQYISISYEISRIADVPGISESNVGDYIYVTLVKDEEGISRPDKAYLEKPSGDFIRGKITRVYGNSVTIEYGIEQYFFERGAEFSTRNMQVEVKIDSSGKARISRLLQDMEPIVMQYREPSIP